MIEVISARIDAARIEEQLDVPFRVRGNTHREIRGAARIFERRDHAAHDRLPGVIVELQLEVRKCE